MISGKNPRGGYADSRKRTEPALHLAPRNKKIGSFEKRLRPVFYGHAMVGVAVLEISGGSIK